MAPVNTNVRRIGFSRSAVKTGLRLLRRALAAATLAGVAGAAAYGTPARDAPPADGGIVFVALGDTPYTARELEAFPSLVRAVNAAQPAFVVHVGDVKGGSTPCTDARLWAIARLFAGFRPPLVYTPGDNEWTDCRRPEAGGFDPEERLAALRRIFFSGFFASSDARLGVVRQSAEPAYRDYPENARWTMDGVLFATLHVVGSDNNRIPDEAAAMAEFARRSAADRAWLGQTFEEAQAERLRAVVVFFHADPFAGGPKPGPESGFGGLLAELARAARAFGGPVLLVHGDGHDYRVDRPLLDPADGAPLGNVERVEVFGSPALNAVVVRMAPGTPVRFDVAPLIAPPAAGRRSGGWRRIGRPGRAVPSAADR